AAGGGAGRQRQRAAGSDPGYRPCTERRQPGHALRNAHGDRGGGRGNILGPVGQAGGDRLLPDGNVTASKPGIGFTLVASSPGLMSASSAAFNVTPGSEARLVFQVQPSAASAG